ncbi:MAG: DUF5011 domain-containing protein [Ruminococcaceae bacterium]|nr:DUF5011 domain-containing protein [Oscillospiraceae bacterium]
MSFLSRKTKKGLKRLHGTTKFCMLLALIVGIGIGVFGMSYVSKNDRFLLKGESAYSIDMAPADTEDPTPYFYTEEGVEAVCFGRDVSDKLTVTTDLEKDAEGRYIIPTDKEGVYTITYSVNSPKFGESAPNGAILRIRTFTVTAAEEDGRNG